MKKLSLSQLATLLTQKGFRLTKSRSRVYEILLKHEEALSMIDIELLLDDVDKSTVFRSLQLFVEVGALHRIDDGTGIYKFALSSADERPINAGHAHFFCLKCERTYCIEGISSPLSLSLPEGFTTETINLVIRGICANCKKK
ncbi:transcriptional regulator, Fur family [Bacteroidales bacterium KA00251]|nr:transcriptional regulator, Fur family [Bacteroidales bacterium KA00251]